MEEQDFKLENGISIKLELIPDEDASNPRKEYENLGHMVCFHSRYDLGDEHNFSDADDMWLDLAIQADPDVEARIERLDERFDTLGKTYDERIQSFDEKKEEIIEKALSKGFIWLPLYLYDHSGITMSTSGFSCPWDSGQVGIIYLSKEEIRKEYDVKRITKKVLEKAYSVLKSEVETYDQYLTGDVYGYQVTVFDEDECELDQDSCWGFFGSDYAEESGKDAVFSAMVDWASIAEIKKALLTPCECDANRTGTILRGPRSCFNCYVRDLAERSFSDIDQKDVQKLAVEMVKMFHKGNLEDTLQEKLNLN